MSRYHWSILTAWTRPVVKEGKPIVDFVLSFHTPIVLTEKARVHFGELEELSGEESFWLYRVYLPFLKSKTSERVKPEDIRTHGYHSKVVFSPPPDKYKFDISKSKAYFIISEQPPTPKNVPSDISGLLWP